MPTVLQICGKLSLSHAIFRRQPPGFERKQEIPTIETEQQAERFARDLEWVLGSPSLVSADAVDSIGATVVESVGGSNTFAVDVVERQTSPQSLFRFIEEKPSRFVGYYFERLVEYWLRHVRECDVLSAGEQIRIPDTGSTKQRELTVGEVDFIYRNEDVETHLETAVKFYLYYPAEHRSGSHYIGPNCTDNFEKKLNRIREHQLPLSRKYFPGVQCRELLMRGRVFYRPMDCLPKKLPDGLAADHLRGIWIYQGETEWFEQFESKHMFRIIRKPHWLADELARGTDGELLSTGLLRNFLNSHFSSGKHPILVSVLQLEGAFYQEVTRVFIVPEFWPHTR